MNNLRLYQFGNFVFPSENLVVNRELGIKNRLDSSDYYNGQIRTNKYNKDNTEDTLYNISFASLDYSYDQLDSLFYSKPQKIFFIEKIQTQDYVTDYKVYFAYASLFSTSKKLLGCDETIYNYEITLRQIGRRYLIEDNRLAFIKFEDLVNINDLWEVENGTFWEGVDSTVWEDIYNGKAINFNKLLPSDRIKLFECCDNFGIFDYKDLFLKQEIILVDETSNKFIDIDLVGTEGQTIPLLSQTKQVINSLNLNSTSENITNIFEIKKNGVLPALAVNEWIEIINNRDQSGFRITCLTDKCPPILSVFTHKNIKLYDSITNLALNFFSKTDNKNYLKWKIETIGQNSNFFEFSSQYPIYPYFNNNIIDTIQIRRNFTGNLKVRVQNLPTFY